MCEITNRVDQNYKYVNYYVEQGKLSMENNLSASEEYFKKALDELFSNYNCSYDKNVLVKIGTIYHFIATIHVSRSNKIAFDYFFKAMKIFKLCKKYDCYMDTICNIFKILYTNKKYKESINLLLKISDIVPLLSSKDKQIYCYNLGLAYFKNGNFEKSLLFFKKLQSFKECEYHHEIEKILKHLQRHL